MPSPLHADARVHDFAVVLLIGEFVNVAMLPVNRDGSRYGGYWHAPAVPGVRKHFRY